MNLQKITYPHNWSCLPVLWKRIGYWVFCVSKACWRLSYAHQNYQHNSCCIVRSIEMAHAPVEEKLGARDPLIYGGHATSVPAYLYFMHDTYDNMCVRVQYWVTVLRDSSHLYPHPSHSFSWHLTYLVLFHPDDCQEFTWSDKCCSPMFMQAVNLFGICKLRKRKENTMHGLWAKKRKSLGTHDSIWVALMLLLLGVVPTIRLYTFTLVWPHLFLTLISLPMKALLSSHP